MVQRGKSREHSSYYTRYWLAIETPSHFLRWGFKMGLYSTQSRMLGYVEMSWVNYIYFDIYCSLLTRGSEQVAPKRPQVQFRSPYCMHGICEKGGRLSIFENSGMCVYQFSLRVIGLIKVLHLLKSRQSRKYPRRNVAKLIICKYPKLL